MLLSEYSRPEQIQTRYHNNVHIIQMYTYNGAHMYFHDSDEALQNNLSVILSVCVQEIQEHIIHNSVCTAYTHCNTSMYASLNTAQLYIYPLIHTQAGLVEVIEGERW